MPTIDGIFVPDDDGMWFYRGYPADHIMIAAARQRVVIPGERDGIISPEKHNAGQPSDLAASPFTSWTTDRALAEDFADEPRGTVLQLPRLPASGDGWSWEGSPDKDHENEVLLRGVRIDAEVAP